jgi:hypothetical protein
MAMVRILSGQRDPDQTPAWRVSQRPSANSPCGIAALILKAPLKAAIPLPPPPSRVNPGAQSPSAWWGAKTSPPDSITGVKVAFGPKVVVLCCAVRLRDGC